MKSVFVQDLDGDSDKDCFVGGYDGKLNFFLNSGNASNPVFIEQTGGFNPASTIDVGTRAQPWCGVR